MNRNEQRPQDVDDVQITYKYRFPNGREAVHPLRFDSKTFDILNPLPVSLSDWTKLSFHQCPNCKLKSSNSAYCPAAAHLASILNNFRDLISYEPVHVYVITRERIITHYTSAQRALASIMALVMATSGCPVLSYFKPMARIHLPVANDEETQYRAVAMYMTSRLLRIRAGMPAEIEVDGLRKVYDEVEKVNTALSKRFAPICQADAIANAVIRLNSYAQSVSLVLDEFLDNVQDLFHAYLTPDGP